ncbi:MAG TPA: class I SAM-dependent methyltransferase [Fimbriimonadaceae bacterium]|nr:class I SAM-dependent methyltransferase [Fimbriimonadaceae bacterium]
MTKPTPSLPASFGAVAPYYDELMRSVPYRMWVGYYLLLLSVQDEHPKRLLDVCCGTGTVAEMLVDEGFEVSGFDISSPMIERARAKAKRRKLGIEYWVSDAAELQLNREFDAAYSFFDSLNNITEPSRLESALVRVGEHLPAGGSFIFDMNTAYSFEARMFDQQNLSRRAKLRYKWVGEWDADRRIITVSMRFWRDDQEFEEIHRQRAYDEPEVRAMLERAGFRDIRTYHSYTLDPPRRTTDRIHYTAIRR